VSRGGGQAVAARASRWRTQQPDVRDEHDGRSA
jgi:hypothetical protein